MKLDNGSCKEELVGADKMEGSSQKKKPLGRIMITWKRSLQILPLRTKAFSKRGE